MAALKERRRRSEAAPPGHARLNPGRDLDVLVDLAWARCLTTGQIRRLHFPSQRMAQRRMRALLDLGLVRTAMQSGALHRDGVHLLTAAGIGLLAERGAFAGEPPAPGRMPRPQRLAHALAIRDVFVAALVAQKQGVFEVADFRFDEDLAGTEPFRTAGLIPDGFVRLKAGPADGALGIEVDLGTETKAMVASKFTRWLRLLPPAHGAPVARLVVLAPSVRRRDTLAALAAEAGLGAAVGVHLLEEAREALERATRAFGPYVLTVRSERTVPEASRSQIQPPEPGGAAVFLPRRQPREGGS